MAILKKGSRRIIVNGHTYCWNVRGVLKWDDYLGESLQVAIERIDPPAPRILMFDTIYSRYQTVVTPRIVEVVILHALRTGWEPHLPGSAFNCWMTDIDWTTHGFCTDGFYNEWCKRNRQKACRDRALAQAVASANETTGVIQ